MLYTDRVYGPFDISEPVLLELLDTQALNRLRGIHQGGITAILQISPDFSRYDHSVGVCLLLRMLGAPLLEQIAGLLHDLSHLAFSHVIDFVYGRADQTYHEQIFEEMLVGSDVPQVLTRHGFDWHDLLDETRFPLLEQPLPRLCADRLDYFLRNVVPLGLASEAEVGWLLSYLAVREGRIAVAMANTPDLSAHAARSAAVAAATWLGETFMAADDACWSDLRELSIYHLTADAIRAAVASGCLAEADLRGNDEMLWSRLRGCREPGVMERVALVNRDTRFVIDPSEPDFEIVPKVRAVDPEVWTKDGLEPLSRLSPAFAAARAAYVARKDRPWPVRIASEPMYETT